MMPFRFRRDSEGLSCREVGRLLQRYLDEMVAGPHALDAEASTRMSAHLDDCRRCGMEADAYREVKASLARRDEGLAPAALERLRAFGEGLAADNWGT